MLSLRGVDGIEFDQYQDIDQGRPIATTVIDKKVAELQKECPYETIVVDSLTTVADLAMNKVLFVNGRAKGTPQLQDWLQQMNWLKNFIVTMLALPKHVVFIAHEHIEKDENLGTLQALPLVTGKLAGKLGLYFDELYNSQMVMKGKESEFRILTRATSIYTAKSRLGCFEMYEVPDFRVLLGKVKAKEQG